MTDHRNAITTVIAYGIVGLLLTAVFYGWLEVMYG
jgi:hypothetical protein